MITSTQAETKSVVAYGDFIPLSPSGLITFELADDLALELTSSPQAPLGEAISYTLSVTNVGPNSAANVVVTQTLPSSITFDSASPSPSVQAGQALGWNLGTLAGFESRNFIVTGTVDTAIPLGSSLVATAVVTSTLTELTLSNNTTVFTSTASSGTAVDLVVTHPTGTDLLVPFEVTVTAYDAYGNVATGYEKNVTLSTTDSSTQFPVSHQFSLADQGVYTFSGLALKTAGVQTITVTDGTLTKTFSMTVDDEVVVDQSLTWAEPDIALQSLVVTGTGTVLTLQGATVITAENITVGQNATISVDGQGHPVQQGLGGGGNDGIGWPNGPAGSGGGYGGYGGARNNGAGAGGPYGAFDHPDQMGSGGGSSTSAGGAGGGAIHLVVGGTLQVDGRISANGNDGLPTPDGSFKYSGGGGSGGSIWLEAETLTGGGQIQANGGSGGTYHAERPYTAGGGGGSGGRIAVDTTANTFSGTLQAIGGRVYTCGGGGTIYLSSGGVDQLLVDNDGCGAFKASIVSGPVQFDTVQLTDAGNLEVKSGITLTANSLQGDSSAWLTALGAITATDVVTVKNVNIIAKDKMIVSNTLNIYTTTLDIQGELVGAENISLDHNGQLWLQAGAYPNGHLAVNELDVLSGTLQLAAYDSGDTNYGNDYGFTLSANNLQVAGAGLIEANGLGYSLTRGPGTHNNGSSHGGYGGGSVLPYGDLYQPDRLGSSGDNGRGGGAVRLAVTNVLTLNGAIQANGIADGSGGSVWLQVSDSFTGTGQVQARGGNQLGGGGRIAIYAFNNDYTGTYTATFGGGGSCPSGLVCDGTVYLNSFDPVASTVVAKPDTLSIPESSLVTVTLKLGPETPAPGRAMKLSLSPGTNAYVNGQLATGLVNIGTTDGSGVVTATITSTLSGLKVAGAQTVAGETLTQTALITFTPGPADPGQSLLTVIDSNTAAADGVDTVELRVTARDAFDNPLVGASVELTSTAPVNLPQGLMTNSSGLVTASITGTVVGTAEIKALIDNVLITQTQVITFKGADLELTKSALTQITSGFPLSYTLTVKNTGLLTATSVVITDTLPGEVTFITQTSSYDFYTDTNTVVWTVGELPPNSTNSFVLQVQVAATATGGTVMTNTIAGDLAEVELETGDNQADWATTILDPAPALTVSPAGLVNLPAHVGESGVITLSLTNPGTGVLDDVAIQAPPYIDWVEVEPTSIASIGLGETRIVTITASPALTQDVGWYTDLITITSELGPITVPLEVYVHPDLVDFTLTVKNNLNNNISGATIFLRKSEASVEYYQGTLQQQVYPSFNVTTNANGQWTFSGVEVGPYTYTLWAENHTPYPLTDTVIITSGATELVFDELHALPTLSFEPNPLTVAVPAGGSNGYQVQVRNSGPGHAENFEIETPPDLPWLSSGWPEGVELLEAGEAVTITLLAAPPMAAAGVTYQNYITVTAEGVLPSVLLATIEVTTSNVANLVFNVTRIGGTTPISQAKVLLVNQTGQTINTLGNNQTTYPSYQGETDPNGQVIFPNVPVAQYSYVVQANGYYAQSGTVNAMALGGDPANGGGTQVPILLEADPFTYTWVVTETTITDTYAVTVEVTYEAEVAQPRLYVSPLLFCPGESPQYLVANMGLVTLTNLSLNPNHEGVAFGGAPVNIGTLAPGQVQTGSFSTTGSTTGSSEGVLLASAEYNNGVAYQASSQTRKLCVSPSSPSSGGSWSWSWTPRPNGQPAIIGSYQGSQPTFPSVSTTPPAAPTNEREQAKLILSGNATLERQAFLASLELTSHGQGAIEDIRVDIEAKNVYSQGIVGAFAVTPTVPTLLGTLPDQYGAKISQTWTLIPGELGITNPEGEVYNIRAQIVYTYGGVVFTTTTQPVAVTVLPQPRLRLTFSHSQPDSNGDFYLEVGVENQGYGVARNLKLDLSSVTVLSDLDLNGRSLFFNLISTTINGQPQPAAYIFDFGNLQPDESKTGRWDISVRASDGALLINPRITDFRVGCRHLPYQGLELSSLIVNCGPINQFFLTSDCPFCSIEQLNLMVGGPINTGNGNYSYRQGTPSIPTVGDPLQLEWVYNSLNSGAFPDLPASGSALGTGWTHNYDLELDFSQPDRVVFKAAHGSPLIFERVKETFRPAPGIWGTLTRTAIITGQYVYTLTAANQATYVFTDTGQLLRQIDPQGNVTELSYDSQNRLVEVREPVSGRYLTLAYDAEGRLSQVSDPISRTTRFGYTVVATGPETVTLLTAITDTRNEVWDYDYTQLVGGEYILSKVTDPDDRLVEETGFDDLGRAISQTFRGEYVGIDYHEDGQRTITDGLGRVMTHTYNSQFLLVGQTDALGEGQVYTLDSNYNRTFTGDKNGNPAHYEQTQFGLLKVITDALTQTTRYEYDDRNNLVKSTDARGKITTYLYDGQNNLISTTNHLGDSKLYTYNAQGQQTSMTDENGNITRYGYDAIGQRTVITDTLGHTTTFQYDTIGRVVTTTDALGKVTINIYDGADHMVQVIENYLAGQPQNHQDEYNLITSYTYDGAGRQETTTDTLGRVSRNIYDAAGRLDQAIQNEHSSVTTQNYLNQYNLVTDYSYDETGNKVSVIDTLGRETRTEYDDLNRVERIIVNYVDGAYNPAQPDEDIITSYSYDANGNRTSEIDPRGYETRTEYDELNQVKRIIVNYQDGVYNPAQPDRDLITSYTYDEVGNKKTVTDPLGRVTRYDYDDLNRVMTTTNSLSGTMIYSYDAVGNKVAVRDAENRTTGYEYDALNRVVTVTNALTGQTAVAYDAGGNQIQITDANGHITQYGYDRLSRRIVITDALNNITRLEYDAAGRLVKTTDALDQMTLNEYASNDNLIKMTKNYLDGQPQNYLNEYNIITRFAYDPLNQPIVMTDTLGRVTRYEYDEGSRAVKEVVNYIDGVYNPAAPDEDIVTLYQYDANSNIIITIDALNHKTQMEYDAVNRMTRQVVNYVDGTYSAAAPDEDIVTRYNYDGAGNLISTIDTLGRESRIVYDDLDRAEQKVINYSNGIYNSAQPDEDLVTAYEYDQVGNPVKVIDPLNRETRYSYDALNRIQMITNPISGTTTYAYDAVGNQVRLTDAKNRVSTYAYDALNRVVTTTNPLSGTAVITYDAVGNRLQVINPKLQVTTYQYDSLYRLKVTTDAENQITTYAYDPQANLLAVTDPESQTTTYVYDELNRVIQLADPFSGTTTTTYDALGNRLSMTDANNQTTSYIYDDLNRLIQVTDPNSLTTTTLYDGLGNRLSVTNGANETTEFEYDEVNRLVLVRDPLGHETIHRYDGAGNRVAAIDAEGVESHYSYDELDRLTGLIENYVDGVYSSGVTDEDVKTEYGYDAVGNRLSVTNANNQTTTYKYDALNRSVEVTDPENNITRYGYDVIGNRTVMTDANGIVTSFTYDEVNRLTQINYSDSTPDVSFSYDKAGNRLTMGDSTGTTSYTYDELYRLTELTNGANQTVGYNYDPVGNVTHLIYPDNKVVTYTYDAGNRLETVTNWKNGQFGYNYDEANRLTGLSLPNGVDSSYNYDEAGRLTLLAHANLTETLASYSYSLDRVGNRRTLTETVEAILDLSNGTSLESGGLVVIEAEHFGQRNNGDSHQWLLKTSQSGYTGTSYLQPLPDTDRLYQTNAITSSPSLEYGINFSTPGTYTLWLRGSPTNARGDSAYVGFTPGGQPITTTGFAPRSWSWAKASATLPVTQTGVLTLNIWMREDGLRLDRLVLITDTAYIPSGFGLTETERLTGTTGLEWLVDRTIEYEYDSLYRLTEASYTSGELYQYEYDPVGNRLQQIINGDTTSYQYDAANRLEQVNGQSYSHDANGNLLATGVMTNTFDAANRLVSSTREGTTVQPIYNGIGDRVGQTVGITTTHFALDVRGLPEVIYTSEGAAYLHLPGVVITEKGGEVRYLLSDGLGSIRQAVDDNGAVVAYNGYDPYGNPEQSGSQPYGFTGEWWQEEIELLHLRARWYMPETGRFLSRDPLFTMAEYAYASNNPINRVDPSGLVDWNSCVVLIIATCHLEFDDWIWGIAREVMAFHGIDEAFHYQDDRINDHIMNNMEPQMWDLNPHLHTPGAEPMEDVGLWHCPACADNPTVSAEIPFGIINLPPSWPPYSVVAPPPAPPLPPVIEPGPLLQIGSRPVGADGYVEGAVGTVVAFGCQMSVQGSEVVYDFTSGERAIFRYRGSADYYQNIKPLVEFDLFGRRWAVGPTGVDTSLFGGGLAYYVGPIWGFKEDDLGGLEGEYSGVFWSGGLSTSYTKMADWLPKKMFDLPKVNLPVSGSVSVFSGVDDEGVPNFQLWGVIIPVGVSQGVPDSWWSKISGLPKGKTPIPNFPVDISVGWTKYEMVRSSYVDYRGGDSKNGVNYLKMAQDINNCVDSPIDYTVFGINPRREIGQAFQQAINIGQQIVDFQQILNSLDPW